MLIFLHVSDLLVESEVVIYIVLHVEFIEESEQVMHKCYKTVSSVHQSRDALVTHPHSLVFLVNKVLLVSVEASGHTCMQQNALISIYT